MPELPEVETIARDLRESLIGAVIESASIYWPRTIATHDPEAFRRSIRGQRIHGIARRAKFLILELDGAALLLHLRMTGRIVLEPEEPPAAGHDRARLLLADGRCVRFVDARKFGRIYLVRDAEAFCSRLGPEPFSPELDHAAFHALLRARRRQLKPLLLDQRFLAGLGNIYADEALWEAQLHPLRLAWNLSAQEASRLLLSIRLVLDRGIANLGTSLGDTDTNFYSVSGRRGRNKDALRVFRRAGEPCPRCGSVIKRIIVGQRGTHFCPRCQRAPAA